jgi:two-component system, NtrC family, nitrogen regulation response regulator GlnG
MTADRAGLRGSGEGRGAARLFADAVPGLVAELSAAGSERLYREALELLERPLLAHLLAATGGNQLRAARLLGLNRNTLRKRCRVLGLTLPRAARRTTQPEPAPLA